MKTAKQTATEAIGIFVTWMIAWTLVMLSIGTSHAAGINLAWDAMPTGQAWTAVRIYEKSGTAYNKVTETPCGVSAPCLTARVDPIPVGVHTYVAKSVNGQYESDESNAVSVTCRWVYQVKIVNGIPLTVRVVIC